MRNTIPLFMLIVVSLMTTHQLIAQEEETGYAIVQYMKVTPGMEAEYLECEKAWRDIHTQRIASGEITAWHLEEVIYTGGLDVGYDYLTITHVKNWTAIEKMGASIPALMDNVPAEQEEVVTNTENYRTMVKTEIWTALDMVMPEDAQPVYVVENFNTVPVGGWGDYLAMETEFAKPVIQERVKTGKQAGWVLTEMIGAYGTAYPYQCSTVDFFDSWEAIGGEDNDSWKTVYPAMSYEQIGERINAAKTSVRSEIRRIIHYIE